MTKQPILRLRRAIAMVEDLVFPPICGGCQLRGTWLCDTCRQSLEMIPRPICTRCGQPVDQEASSCANCAYWPVEFGAMRAAYTFGGPIRDSIHRFKYQGEFARAPFLANLVFGALKRPEFPDDSNWDMVACVPLHARRRRQRGFDQSRLIARYLATSLELSATTELKRVIDTPSQVGRSATERRANVIDAFAWSGEELNGAEILLVDDVITTGATMMSASRALIRAGAKRVDGIAIAREVLH